MSINDWIFFTIYVRYNSCIYITFWTRKTIVEYLIKNESYNNAIFLCVTLIINIIREMHSFVAVSLFKYRLKLYFLVLSLYSPYSLRYYILYFSIVFSEFQKSIKCYIEYNYLYWFSFVIWYKQNSRTETEMLLRNCTWSYVGMFLTKLGRW
jgi:hypothetical protein